MKIQNYLAVVIVLVTVFTLPPIASAQSRNPIAVADHYVANGQPEKALAILKKNMSWPGVPAKIYKIKQMMAKGTQAGGLEGKLEKVVIPQVKFDAVPLSDALTYIQQRTSELTGGKFTPNMIYSGTVEQSESTTVTMSVRDMPVPTLLKYIGSQTRSKIRYDKHAVMVSPYVQETVAAPAAEEYNPFLSK